MKSSKLKPVLWVTSLYIAQGLPFSIVRQMGVVLLKNLGASLPFIGSATSSCGIAWTFKFLWSPFIDQISTKRKWILGMQSLLILISLFTGIYLQFQADHYVIWGIFMVISFISATHDIAIDGFYLETLDKAEQAKFSGLQQMGYRLAMMIGNGALVWMAGATGGWMWSFILASALFALMLIWHYFQLSESKEKKITHQKIKYIEGFISFLKLPNIGLAIAFILLFRLGEVLMLGMASPFFIDAGMTLKEYGFYSGVLGFIAVIVSTMTGGYLISKYGLSKMIWRFGLIQNLAIPLYAAAYFLQPPTHTLGLFIIIEQIANGLGNAAAVNFTMRQIHPNFKATHYAVASSLTGLTTMLAGFASGFGAQKFGYGVFFLIAFAASLPGMALLPWIARRPECQLKKD